MATANSLRPGIDTASAFTHPTDIFSLHLQSMLELRNSLDSNAPANHLLFHWKYYPGYSHPTVPLPAEYDGLRSLFSFYALDFPFDRFFLPSYRDDTLLAGHYAAISRRMGYTVAPPEIFVNNLGYGLLEQHQLDRAFYYFDLNVRNYPLSFNVYDSMGDYWLARGDKGKAAKSFKKALSLRENPDTRKKLEAL